MRQVREVIRLKWAGGLRDRKIAHSLRVSRPTVAEYVRRAQAVGLSWPLPETLDEAALERLLFPAAPAQHTGTCLVPDWSAVQRELKRKGVTLFLLWQEYKAATPEGFQYSWFGQAYRAWAGTRDLVMRQQVVYLSPAAKSHRLTHRLSEGQKGLYERALMASQRPSSRW